jgi:hypothetical protein
MSKVITSSSSTSSNVLPLYIFPHHLTGRRVSLSLGADGTCHPLPPAQLRAQIKRPLELIKAAARFFAQRSARCKHRRQAALPALTSIFAQYPACHCVPVRLMFPCVAFACQRLATAPADMHIEHSTWGWAEVVMERVTRGHVKKVQVRLQRRACCAVRYACRASACVRCLFDACCSKRCLVFRCVQRLLRIASFASSVLWRLFLCAGCCCRPRCRRTQHF